LLSRQADNSLAWGKIDSRSTNVIGAAIYPTASTSVANVTYTYITLGGTLFDSSSIKSGSSLVIPAGLGGKWLVSVLTFGYYSTGANRTGSPVGHETGVYIDLNGTGYLGQFTAFNSRYVGLTLTTVLTAGDVIKLAYYHNYGSTLHTWMQGTGECYLSAIFLGA